MQFQVRYERVVDVQQELQLVEPIGELRTRCLGEFGEGVISTLHSSLFSRVFELSEVCSGTVTALRKNPPSDNRNQNLVKSCIRL